MTTTMEDKGQRISFAVGHNFKVDREAGRLSDLVLIAGNREAKGHGLWIDGKTLEGGLESVQGKGGRLRAFVGHPSMMDSLTDSGGARLLKMPGFFEEIEIDGDRLVARSFTFFDAFKEQHAAEYATLLELAEKAPDLFGLSIESYGHAVYVDGDGNEYSEAPQDVELEHGGMPVFRITDLTAAAFVDEPAATDGLFARFARAFGLGGPGKDLRLQIAEVAKAFLEFSEAERAIEVKGFGLETLSQNPAEPDLLALGATVGAAPTVGVPPGGKGEAKQHEALMIETINTHFAADPERRDRAILAFAADASLTLEAIEAKLKEEDRQENLANLSGHVAELMADNAEAQVRVAELEVALAAAEADRDAWKQKFESGHPGEVDLGGPSSSATTGENPWAKGHINRTRQIEILRRDPEEAKALKAAAGHGVA